MATRSAITVPRFPINATNPTSVSQLMAGAIWLPGVGTTTPSGNLVVTSQATQSNTMTTVGVTGDIPVQTTASNGATVWNFGAGGTYAALRVLSPGSAMQWTQKGTYAGWFKAASLTGSVQQLFSQWPELTTPQNRVTCLLTDGVNTALNMQGSIDGQNTDDPTFATPDHRWKYNSSAGYDFTQWHFLRWTFDYSLSNYDAPGGQNLSYKLKFYCDENWDEGTGFSAPHDGPLPDQKWGNPPNGPIRAPMWPSSYRFTLGATDTLGGSWRGYIGPFYIANEDDGKVPDAVWKGVMLYNAPA